MPKFISIATRSIVRAAIAGTLLVPASSAQSVCDNGIQDSGSKYRICMPPAGNYNGNLIIFAHGYQDAGTPVEIPEDQLCFSGLCLPDLVNNLGFAFATNSYSKTGLAVRQGMDDILDLVGIFTEKQGAPNRIYQTGASEGGLISTLLVEQHPEIFSAGLAACGPVGDFPFQINYMGDARATFQYFFPGLIPGDPFHPDQSLVDNWSSYYDTVVKPTILHATRRSRLDQWVAVARLPYDSANYLATVELSARDVLRYSVVNINDAAATLGGFPYDNRKRLYFGSKNDLLLNLGVPRVSADAAAIAEMKSFYNTRGVLQRPVISTHTLRDQQVPYAHEVLYNLKTLVSGAFPSRHVNVPVDRYGHCNFTPGEVLFSLALMLAYDANLNQLSGVSTLLKGDDLARFEQRAREAKVPYRLDGFSLSAELNK